MQLQDDRGLLYEFRDTVLLIVSFLCLVQVSYVLLVLWTTYTGEPFVLAISEEDESYNV